MATVSDSSIPVRRIVTIPRLAFLVLVGVTLGAVSYFALRSSASALPPLPQVPTSSFEPGVRDQIEGALSAARANPKDPAVVGELGMMLHAYMQLAAAGEAYQRAHLLEPEEFKWLYYRGVALALSGQNDAALSVFQEALPLRSDYFPLREKLGRLLLATGDTENAMLHYRAALEEEPASATSHFGLGQTLRAQGRLEAAARQFRKALSLAPRFSEAHYAVGLVYRELGDENRAREHLDLSQLYANSPPSEWDPLLAELTNFGQSATRFRHRARELASRGQSDAAISELLKALEFDSQSVLVHVDLARIHSRLGQFDKADHHFRAALTIHPNAQTARLSYSRSLIQQGRLAEAFEILQELVEINPHSAEGHLHLGTVLDDLGRQREAMDHYQIALRNDPSSTLVNFQLARHLVARGDLDAAEAHIKQLRELDDPDRGRLLYQIGLAHGRSGHPEKAVAYLQEAHQSATRAGLAPLVAEIDRALGHWSQTTDAR